MDSVSVIIPCFNKEKYLESCIESIIEQTYKKLEIIIVDDCSTDNSYLLAQKLENKYTNVHSYKNNHNLGVSETRNNGVCYAKSKFITFLDADDFYYSKDKISNEIEIAKKSNNIIAFSNIIIVNDKGEIVDKIIFEKKISGKKLRMRNYLGIKQIQIRDFIFDKHIFERVGKFKANCSLYEDLDLLLRLSYECDFVGTCNDGTAYRQVGNGLSSKLYHELRNAQLQIVNNNLKKENWFIRIVILNSRKILMVIRDIIRGEDNE